MTDKENPGISLDEIAEYYRDKNDDIASSYSVDEPTDEIAHKEETEHIFVNEESHNTPFETKKKNIKFFSISGGIALVILLVIFIAGFATPKAEEDVNFALAQMYKSSPKYIDAQNKIKALEEEKENIKKQIETNQSSLITITDFESNTGELKTKLKVLTDELEGLNKEIEIHKKNIDKIEKNIDTKSNVTYTLTPGIYTVGENINANNYNVNGKGIISVSDSAGNLKVNTVLSGNDFSTELAIGDVIKLETKATFSPVNG